MKFIFTVFWFSLASSISITGVPTAITATLSKLIGVICYIYKRVYNGNSKNMTRYILRLVDGNNPLVHRGCKQKHQPASTTPLESREMEYELVGGKFVHQLGTWTSTTKNDMLALQCQIYLLTQLPVHETACATSATTQLTQKKEWFKNPK